LGASTRNVGIDAFRIYFQVLIVWGHVTFFGFPDPTNDVLRAARYVLISWARASMPFYFIVAGYFLQPILTADAETFVANEPRFELVREHDSMTAAGEYRDTETGTHFMLKNTTEGYDMEAAHEVEARLLLDDTSMLHMDALAASDLDINGNGAVIARWADQDPAVDRVLGIGLTPESEGSLSAAEDAVRFQTFDSAVNNTDRHDFNYLSVVDRQGDTRFYAIDHSLIDPSGMYAEDQEEWGERFARVFAHDPEEFSTRLSEQDAIALSQRFGQEVLDNLPRLEAYANDLEANGAVYTAGQVREDIGFIGARLRALVEGDEFWYEAEPF